MQVSWFSCLSLINQKYDDNQYPIVKGWLKKVKGKLKNVVKISRKVHKVERKERKGFSYEFYALQFFISTHALCKKPT